MPQKKKQSTKNQMRSIQRMMGRDGVPEKVRLEKQRELDKLQGRACLDVACRRAVTARRL